MRKTALVLASLLALPLLLGDASSASAPTRRAADKSAPYSEFEKVCLSVFARRSGGDDSAGRQICECTSKESKHQGVTVPELKRETAKIRKNPKYKIKNPKLLASFHYCVILAMDQKSREMDQQPPEGKWK